MKNELDERKATALARAMLKKIADRRLDYEVRHSKERNPSLTLGSERTLNYMEREIKNHCKFYGIDL